MASLITRSGLAAQAGALALYSAPVMRLALPLALAALAFLCFPLAGEVRADEDALRTIELRFTPTKHAQIAVWIEAMDGTFMSTVGLTQAVSVRGIGNRPGADQMNSGYHWPYGRREGVLPIWAHRRAEAPGAGVSADHLPEPPRGICVADLRGLDR